jgi:hypothetical protein
VEGLTGTTASDESDFALDIEELVELEVLVVVVLCHCGAEVALEIDEPRMCSRDGYDVGSMDEC